MKRFLFLLVVLAVIGLVDWAAAAWSAPLNLPPTCVSGNPGCDAPIHTGTNDQNKLGRLGIKASTGLPLFDLDVGGLGFFGAGLGVVGDVLVTNSLGVALPPLQSPNAALDVNGQIKIRGGAPGAGKVLSSDSNGLATWETPTSPVSPGSSVGVMYLKTISTVLTPSCPSGFVQADYQVVRAGDAAANNNVRTCYHPAAFCQVLELLAFNAVPAACPADFTQAQYDSYYLGSSLNNGRACYKCPGAGGVLGVNL